MSHLLHTENLELKAKWSNKLSFFQHFFIFLLCSELRAVAMKLIILFILISLSLNVVDATTKGYAFGTSDLISSDSNFSAAKTLLENAVDSPDLNSDTNGQFTTKFNLTRTGVYELNQGIDYWVDNYWGFRGKNLFHNFYSGENVTNANLTSNGNATTNFFSYHYDPVAITETIGYATSSGISNYSAIAKTFTDSAILNPVINFTSQGEVATEFRQNCSGVYQLNQGIATSPDNYWGLYGRGSFYSSFYKELEGKSGFYNSQHSTFSGSQVTNATTRSYGNVAVGTPNFKNFDLSKTQSLETNVTSKWSIDKPADLFKQDIALEFRTADDEVAYSGYDIKRDLAIGDIECLSEMEVVYHNT